MRILFSLLALLLATPALGQSIWPANKVQFADTDTLEVERDRHRVFAFGSLPTCDGAAFGNVFIVNDASDNANCDGAGSANAECLCDGTGYVALSGGGGGGGDNIFIQGVAAVNPDFRDEGDIDVILCTAAGAPDPDCPADQDVIYRYGALSIENADVATAALITGAKIQQGNTGTRGTLRLADQTETDAGTNTAIAVTPETLHNKPLVGDVGGTFGATTVDSVQPGVAGPGLGITAGILETKSDESGFLEDLGAGDLICGAGNAGKMAVNDADVLQYCDGTAGEARRTAALGTDVGEATAVAAGAINDVGELAVGIRTGVDGRVVTGTAGGTGLCAEWNIDGDLVEAASAAACGSGGGEVNTHSSDGGGLVLTAIVPKVGVDLRLVSLAPADFDSAVDLVTIDDTKWAKDSELHAQSHTIVSHSDTTAEGSELNTLTDGSTTTLHAHDIDALVNQATWATAATKITADLTIDGVEVDYEAGGAEGFPRLAQSNTPPPLECDAAGEAGRLYWDLDGDADGELMGCRGVAGWKAVDDDGGAGGFVSFDIDGDTGPVQTVENLELVRILGDATGINTVSSATNLVTVSFVPGEVSTVTFGEDIRVDFPGAQAITGGGTIADDACGSVKLINSVGDVTTSTTDTFTAPAAGNKGCWMLVCNNDAEGDVITLDANANFRTFGSPLEDNDLLIQGDDCVAVVSSGASGTWYQAGAEQLGRVNEDRFKMVDSHTHSFYDIMEDTLARDTGADVRDTPFHGGAAQTSCEDGSDYCPDGWIDGISTIRALAKTLRFNNRAISKSGLKTGSLGGSPFDFRMEAQPSARGQTTAMRIQLQINDLDIDSNISGGSNWALRVNTAPSSVDFNYDTLIHTRHEEDIGTLEKVMYLDITKFGAVVKQGIDMSHGQLDVAFNMGENDYVTQCTDIWENAQTTGSADGTADRDGITALCTDVFDRAQISGSADSTADRDGLTALCTDLFDDCINCVQTSGSPDTKCDDDGFTAVETDLFNVGTLPQSAGSADGFCDSDGATEVERDTNDTGSLPQSGCDSVVSCSDGLCDSDGATAVADDFERFGDTDFEEVMMGDVLDNADGQHTHAAIGIEEDSVGTSELDDGADAVGAGFWVQIDPGDTTQFNYRTDGELKSDIAIDCAADVANCTANAITGTGVTFENLNTNGDIGFGATQVPQGDLVAALAGATFTGPLIAEDEIDLGTQLVFGNPDTTPDVDGSAYWKTNAVLNLITDFDGTQPAGSIIYVESDGSAVFDCTGSQLLCGRRDMTTADGDVLSWIFDGTFWSVLGRKQNYTEYIPIVVQTPATTDDFLIAKALGGGTTNFEVIGLNCVAHGGSTANLTLNLAICAATGLTCTDVHTSNLSVTANDTNVALPAALLGDTDGASGQWLQYKIVTVTTAPDSLDCLVEVQRFYPL